MEKLYRIRLNSPESLVAGVPYYLLVNEAAGNGTEAVKGENFPELQAKQLRDEYVQLFQPDFSLDLEEAADTPEGTNYVEWNK